MRATPNYKDKVTYSLPMRGTSTLLNIFACKKLAGLNDEFYDLILDKADLGVIDYSSSWVDWGDELAHYFQNTPLLDAISVDNITFALKYMVQLNKLPLEKRQEILNYKDKFKAGFHTALEFAIRRGWPTLATTIVQAGANPNLQPFIFSYGGKSPLHMVCMLLGNSWTSKGWPSQLGDDVELIVSLLEAGANYNYIVPTEVYVSTEYSEVQKWEIDNRTPGDYLNMELVLKTTKEAERMINCCNNPAFSPKEKGDIKHPF